LKPQVNRHEDGHYSVWAVPDALRRRIAFVANGRVELKPFDATGRKRLEGVMIPCKRRALKRRRAANKVAKQARKVNRP
jgi:hypothetical protein